MYSVHCATELVDSTASFCHKCGRPVAVVGGVASAPTNGGRSFPFTWVFWLLLLCAVSAWIGYLLPLFAGHEVKGQIAFGTMVWNGGVFAYVWKKRHNKGWLGFGLGVLVAVAAIVLISFGNSYLRVQALLAQPAASIQSPP